METKLKEKYRRHLELCQNERERLFGNVNNMPGRCGKVILSVDEKPGIQALGCPMPDRMNVADYGWIARYPEYVRYGTCDLFAGLDLVNGKVVSLLREVHKSQDFVDYLMMIEARYFDADLIVMIMDNHSIHTSAETKAFLDLRPGRFKFVFTPTHSSWLNPVESFFSKLSKQCLRGMRVESKAELIERIGNYIEGVNENPVIYKWTYKIEEEKTEAA
jgi:transposase